MQSLATYIKENMEVVLVELRALQIIAFRLVMNCFADVLLTFIHSSYSCVVRNDNEVPVGAPC